MHAMSVKLYALQAIRAKCVALLSRERCKSPAQLVTKRSPWTLEFDHSVDDTEMAQLIVETSRLMNWICGASTRRKNTARSGPSSALPAREQPLLNDWIVHHQVEEEHPELECREHQKNLQKQSASKRRGHPHCHDQEQQGCHEDADPNQWDAEWRKAPVDHQYFARQGNAQEKCTMTQQSTHPHCCGHLALGVPAKRIDAEIPNRQKSREGDWKNEDSPVQKLGHFFFCGDIAATGKYF